MMKNMWGLPTFPIVSRFVCAKKKRDGKNEVNHQSISSGLTLTSRLMHDAQVLTMRVGSEAHTTDTDKSITPPPAESKVLEEEEECGESESEEVDDCEFGVVVECFSGVTR